RVFMSVCARKSIFNASPGNSALRKSSSKRRLCGPILSGVLYGLKADVAAETGGYENIKLKMLPRLRREGDGDIGICFEYAVHDAMNKNDARVVERINDAIKICKIRTKEPKSILFGMEKTGSIQLIDTANN